jgi:hypothetical protein
MKNPKDRKLQSELERGRQLFARNRLEAGLAFSRALAISELARKRALAIPSRAIPPVRRTARGS